MVKSMYTRITVKCMKYKSHCIFSEILISSCKCYVKFIDFSSIMTQWSFSVCYDCTLSSVPQGTYLSSWSSICCISPSLRLLSQALSLQCPIFRVSWRFSGSHRWWPITNGHLWTTWVHCKWGKRELVTIKSTCMLPIVQITVLLFKKAQSSNSVRFGSFCWFIFTAAWSKLSYL